MKRALFCILLILFSDFSQAASVPVYTGRVNNSIGSILNSKIGKTAALGAEYDAKFQRTMSSITSGLTASATTLVAGGAAVALGAISWPALLVSAGVSGVVSGVVSLGVDKFVNWLWPTATHPNQVQLSGSGMGGGSTDPKSLATIPNTYPGILDLFGGNADIWFVRDTTNYKVGHIKTVEVVCPTAGVPFCDGSTATINPMDYTFSSLYGGPYPGLNGYFYNGYRRHISTSSDSSTYTYQILFDFVPAPDVTLLPPAYIPKWLSPEQAVQELPQGYISQPLSDEQLAVIANAAWRKASTADGDIFQWSAANPITASDISTWRAANPQLVPTVNDFISPVASPGATTVPVPNPGTSTVVTPPSGTASSPASTTSVTAVVDWGDFTPPTLEETPTTASILDPIFNMWPEWQNYAFPPHNAECPKPTFTALNHVFTFDQMCYWVELIRSAVQAAFAFAWALMVIFIVMGA